MARSDARPIPSVAEVVARLGELVRSGRLRPGIRLPDEPRLSVLLDAGAELVSPTVRALLLTGVLQDRAGGGVALRKLRAEQLLVGVGLTGDLLADGVSLASTRVRRMLEPQAAALAAGSISAHQLAEIGDLVNQTRLVAHNPQVLIRYDVLFHRAIAVAGGNDVLASTLDDVCARAVGAQVWRGSVCTGSGAATVRQHRAIHHALGTRDAGLSQAVAQAHVAGTEDWLRRLRDELRPAPESS
jgi:GntR family transcriptional regulator, transcriptional repressor for pyruvate dehydrogenase complex